MALSRHTEAMMWGFVITFSLLVSVCRVNTASAVGGNNNGEVSEQQTIQEQQEAKESKGPTPVVILKEGEKESWSMIIGAIAGGISTIMLAGRWYWVRQTKKNEECEHHHDTHATPDLGSGMSAGEVAKDHEATQ